MLIFLHQQKTGGLTMRPLLKRNYHNIFGFPSAWRLDEQYEIFQQLSEEEKSKIDCVHGFISYGLHDAFTQSSQYLTFMRHPVERTLSLYYYVLNKKTSWMYKHFNRAVSIEEFLDEAPRYENHQTRTFLYSQPNTIEDLRRQAVPDNALELAIENIEKHFPIIGLTERYDESLLMIKQIHNWKSIRYRAVNVARNRPKRRDTDPAIIRRIEDKVQVDLALYDYVTKRFERQLEAYQGDMAFDLRKFHVMNRLSGIKSQVKNKLNND